MNISAKSEYAVRALLELAANDGAPLSAGALAKGQHLPRKFLEAILVELKRAGLLASQRGPVGGYRLAKPPEDIAVGAVLRAVDGPLAEVRGLRPHETAYAGVAEHLPKVWVAVRVALRDVLDQVSIADLLSGHLPEHVESLTREPDAWQNR